jgi:hypothetical protein
MVRVRTLSPIPQPPSATRYYARLEQQRGPQPSEQMLASPARALRLTDDEHDYLFQIAGHNAPTAATAATAARALRLTDDEHDYLFQIAGHNAATAATAATYVAPALLRVLVVGQQRFAESRG